MALLGKLTAGLKALFLKRKSGSELDDELRAYVEASAAEKMKSGMSPDAALRAARLEMGSTDALKEEVNSVGWESIVNTFQQDFRFAIRMLRKSPGFTSVAILTLTLGIGANTAIFSVVYAALLRPLPYFQPHRLITLGEVRPHEELATGLASQYWNASYPDYIDWSRQSRTFSSLAGFQREGFVVRGSGEPRFISGGQSTTNFFSTLGVTPLLGRDFASGEEVASGPKVAILSYAFWRSEFAGDPRVLGRSIQLDSSTATIVGVLPREFEFAPGLNAQIWVPLHVPADRAARRNLRWMPVIGRLAAGVTAEQAQTEMTAITSRLALAYPQENGAIQVLMMPLGDRIVGQVRPLLLILFGAVGFLLLIACANVANLLLVRASGRRREFVIRVALGAGRGRLISQLLAESMILAAAGGAFGFLVAQWGTSLLIDAIPKAQLDSMPFLRNAHPSFPVFAFLCAAALLTGLAFSLAPALEMSHQRVGDVLKEETRASAGGTRTWLRDVLVVSEVALSLVLLVGAGLMVKSLFTLLHHNPGFETRNLFTFSADLPDNFYPKDADVLRFDRQFTDRVRSLPGVTGIACSSVVPLSGEGNTIRFVIEGRPVAAGHENEANIRDVSAGYFGVMRIPLISGRFFDDAVDTAAAPQHVIVNQAWVNQYLRGENPLGMRIKFTYSPTQRYREIVGVVANNADRGLDSPDEPTLFLPFLEDPDSYMTYVVRTPAHPAAAISGIREALRDVNPRLAVIQPQTMDQIIAESPSVFLRRYPSYLIGSFAALAVILAMVGLFGLVSYSVAQRTRELGIRIALGAQHGDILRLVVVQGVRLALTGVFSGVIAALALTQLMSTLLFGVRAADPSTFAGVSLLLAGIAAAACYIPARRATGVDPIIALRYE